MYLSHEPDDVILCHYRRIFVQMNEGRELW